MYNNFIKQRANRKQDWSVGSIVKVGFLTLKIIKLDDSTSAFGHRVYKLESLDATKKYDFSPHEGLQRTN